MVLCSILPQQPDHVKWAFTHAAAAALRGRDAARISQGQDADQEDRRAARSDALRRSCRRTAAEKTRSDYGLEVVGIEQYKQDDADLSVQISKMNAAGAARHPQDRARRHHADGGQEHQAARPRHADADQRRGPRGVPSGGGGARRQVLLRRLAVAGLRRAARRPAEGGDHQVPRGRGRRSTATAIRTGPARGWDARAAHRQRRSSKAKSVRRRRRCATRSKPSPASRARPASTTCRRPVHQGITVNPLLLATHHRRAASKS